MKLRTLSLGTIGIAAAVVATLRAAGTTPPPPVFSNPLSITNPYHPFVPGRVKHFETQQGHTDAEVFDIYHTDTRTFAWNGTTVTCHILEEHEMEDGLVSEISLNYFAQADDGGVYYFGEVVDTYDNGSVNGHGGSWLVGGPTLPSDPVETANAPNPGLFMPDDPQVGDIFKPEDLFPFVDETDEVIQTGKSVTVPAGHFFDCIQVRESSMLSDSTETKWYAPDIGVIKVKEHGEVLSLDEVTDP